MTRAFYLLLAGSIYILVLALVGCGEEPAQTKEVIADKIVSQEANVAAAEANDPSGKIVFDKLAHDFGSVAPGSRKNCTFTFTNEGPGILKVNRKIRSSCGKCTAVNLEKEEYLPGEKGTIKVSFKPGTRPGKTGSTVYVLSDDPNKDKVDLKVTASIVEKIKLEPKQLSLRLDKDNGGCPDIKLSSTDNTEFAITRITSTSQVISAEYDGNIKATEFILKPRVDLEKLAKTSRGQITFYLKHPVHDRLSVNFAAPPKYKAEPATLVALKAQPGEPVSKTIYILSTYNEPFDIEAVRPKNDIIKVVSLEPVDETRYKLEVEIIAPKMGEKMHFESGLTIEIAGGEKLTINCIGRFAKN